MERPATSGPQWDTGRTFRRGVLHAMGTGGAGAAALAALLTDLKRQSELSYEQLGRKAHLSRSSVHRYCTGRSVPATFAPVEALAAACGASREDLAKLYRLWERADLTRVPTQETNPDPDPANPEPTGSAGGESGGSEAESAEPDPVGAERAKPKRAGSEPVHGPDSVAARRNRKRLLKRGALAAALAAVLFAGGSFFVPDDGPSPTAAPTVEVPMWTNAPRLLEPEFVGVTANSNTGKMPTFEVGSVRLWNSRTRWQNLEPQRGRFSWETLDRLEAGARAAGLPIVLTFGGTPGWASPNGPRSVFTDDSRAGPPDDLADWDRFVYAVAERYRGRIGAYELWDLANHPDFFTGSMSVLVEMTRRASQVIRSVDPAAEVVCPSMGELWDSAALAKLGEFAELGGYDHCDAGAVKLSARNDDEPPETMLPLARKVERTMHAASAGIVMWSTGSAYDVNTQNRVDEERGAQYAVRFYLSGLHAQYRRMYFYNWGSAKIPIVLQPVGGPETKAARYLEQLREWLIGSRIHSCGSGPAAGLPDNLWQCAFDRDGDTFLIWWTIDQDLQVRAAHGTTAVEHLDGSTEAVEPDTELAVSGTPILLRVD